MVLTNTLILCDKLPSGARPTLSWKGGKAKMFLACTRPPCNKRRPTLEESNGRQPSLLHNLLLHTPPRLPPPTTTYEEPGTSSKRGGGKGMRLVGSEEGVFNAINQHAHKPALPTYSNVQPILSLMFHLQEEPTGVKRALQGRRGKGGCLPAPSPPLLLPPTTQL